jgi:hypothetical protein
MNHRVRLVLLWLHRIARAVSALLWRALGGAGFARVHPRVARPNTGKAGGARRWPGAMSVLAAAAIVTVAAATLLIALRSMAAPRQETIVAQSAAGPASPDRRGEGEPAFAAEPLVQGRAEPAAWDHFLSQRQRKGMVFFGGFVVVTAVLLALGRRFSS